MPFDSLDPIDPDSDTDPDPDFSLFRICGSNLPHYRAKRSGADLRPQTSDLARGPKPTRRGTQSRVA
ncbi:MAG: hypothetical protein ACOX52_00185 [Verrucomicrobiota bacterium]